MNCNGSANSEMIGFIGTMLGAVVGGLIAFLTTKWQLNHNQKNADNLDTQQRWTRIYRNMRELAKYVKVVAEYDMHINATYTVGEPKNEPNLQTWMDRSGQYSRKAIDSENMIIDDLCGTNDISKREKKEILTAILTKTKKQETYDEKETRVKEIEDVIKKIVVKRADKEVADILEKIQGD